MLEGFRRLWLGLQRVMRAMSWAQNSAMMAVGYLVGVGPVAIWAKLFGRQLLDLTPPPSPLPESYWSPPPHAHLEMKQANRAF